VGRDQNEAEASRTLRAQWTLDADVVHLNHASYGACPRKVLGVQTSIRDELERQPGAFYASIEARLRAAREALGAFVGASPERLAFTANATVALNAAVRSIPLAPGDEIIVTNHEYNATRNVVVEHARHTGATCVVADWPFVGSDDDAIVDAVLAKVGPRTRAAVLDHVTSQTGLILPIERLIRALGERAIDVVVDGAHAPGMLDLDVEGLAPAWYAGNCHKWLCAPKSAGFLWAREDRVTTTRSAIVSHGAGVEDPARRFRAEFDWPGTVDPSAALAVPAAIDVMALLVDGGWPEIRRRGHALCLEGRRLLCEALEIPPPCAESMLGTMATLPLPPAPGFGDATARSALDRDPLRARLLDAYGIEVPVFRCDAHDGRLVRISAALYNTLDDYTALASALRELLGR